MAIGAQKSFFGLLSFHLIEDYFLICLLYSNKGKKYKEHTTAIRISIGDNDGKTDPLHGLYFSFFLFGSINLKGDDTKCCLG